MSVLGPNSNTSNDPLDEKNSLRNRIDVMARIVGERVIEADQRCYLDISKIILPLQKLSLEKIRSQKQEKRGEDKNKLFEDILKFGDRGISKHAFLPKKD